MKRFKLAISSLENDGVACSFELPEMPYDRWYKVGFQFKTSGDDIIKMAEVSVIPNGYIMIRERWYHRLASRIYQFFKGFK